MITAAWNCPGSGSTLLADLLDSTPFTACGNELSLLARRSIYDVATYRTRIRRASPASPIHLRKSLLKFVRLHTCGLGATKYEGMVAEAQDLAEFLGRDPEGTVHEKTPQNVGCIGEFTSAFPDRPFVHIVREPFAVASKRIEGTTGRAISPDACREHDEGKDFRRRFSKKQIRSWTAREYGQVRDLTEAPVDAGVLGVVKSFHAYRLSDAYAGHADVEAVSFAGAIGRLGYDEDVRCRVAGAAEAPLKKTIGDRIRLFRKYLFDLRAGGGRPRPFAYRHAVTRAG